MGHSFLLLSSLSSCFVPGPSMIVCLVFVCAHLELMEHHRHAGTNGAAGRI